MFSFFFSHTSAISMLMERGVKQNIEESDGRTPYFLMFGTLQGEHDKCRPAQEQFTTASAECGGISQFAVVNQQLASACFKTYDVKKVPSFLFFHHHKHIVYNGPIQSDSFIQFICAYLALEVPTVNESWVNMSKKVIYFSKRRSVPDYVGGLYGAFESLDIPVGFANISRVSQYFPDVHAPGLYMYDGTNTMEYTGPKFVSNVTHAISDFFQVKLKENQ